MGQYIAFDAHKRYTWASVEDEKGVRLREGRIAHDRGAADRRDIASLQGM